MLYKTITLELLQQHMEMYDRLLKARTLLATLDYYSNELITSHEIWKDRLAKAKPGSHPSQIASEALEIALKELEEDLSSESPLDDTETMSLDAAMTFIGARMPHG